MPKLTAKFNIKVLSPCRLEWPEGSDPHLTVTLNDFGVKARLLAEGSFRSKNTQNALNWITGLSELEIEVSRDEDNSPPDAILTTEGGRDLTFRGAYFNLKLPEYKDVAREIGNRIMHFFQYSLLTPLVREIPDWDHSLNNPTWLDADGNALRSGTHMIVCQPVPGHFGELGARTLSPSELPDLQSFLETPTEPSLATTLLSDAQAAWFEKSLRRSVLELAICVEILVKRRFFSEASPAGAAFDYLEDKAKVSVRVLDLIDAIAKEAFSRSYRVEEANNFKKIDYLFRCRNKIAHRGELVFRDESGKTIEVDTTLVEAWWHAVAHLKDWLNSL